MRNLPKDYFSVEIVEVDSKRTEELSPLISLSAYVGGMIQGALEGAGFPCSVTTYDGVFSPKGSVSVFRVELDAKVFERERRFASQRR
jgi:hypothetical protein